RSVPEEGNVDTVRNLHGVTSEGGDLPSAGELRDGDAPADLLEVRLQNSLEGAQYQGLGGRGVEGRDYRAFRHLQREHGQTRCVRLVDVEHVEVVVVDPTTHPRIGNRPETQSCHRTVVRDGHR